ncbi:flagellar biosynthetic protein FliO [uncultured Ramlibacter sp.]|uniref:flagellar biosynthetic protein FliO n=1 Tax=uncultured Ramlibacter sp. TaxID=260755 RepID=UPI002605F141|nr:flagellar biosynthetic protein FliO [uncultured Ramlibacter sp.]
MQSMAWSLSMMVLVLALIPLAMWVVKRMQTIRPAGAQRQLEVVAQLPLGPRERVVMVRVQGRVLVLGATAQHISLLAEADAQDFAPPSAPNGAMPTGFAGLLKNLTAGVASQGQRK